MSLRQTLTLSRTLRCARFAPNALRNFPALQSRNLSTEPEKKSHDEFTAANDARKAQEKRARADDDQADGVRDRILLSALAHVPELGWTREAISAGARDEGFPSVTSGIASSPLELLHFHHERSHSALNGIMEKECARLKEAGERLRIRGFIRAQCEARLKMNVPYLGRWSEGLALSAMPQNMPSSLHLDLQLMDNIWHYAGDKATDYNWYTKRLSLLPIYKSTELAMMNDKSQDFADTWKFLDRRFEDELKGAEFLMGVFKSARNVGAAFATLQNMAGMQKK